MNLRKIVSLALALAMVLSLAYVGAASADVDWQREPTCTEPGWTHVRVGAVGEIEPDPDYVEREGQYFVLQVRPPLGHEEDDGEITTAATCTAEGVMTFRCKLCREILRTEPIPMAPHNFPQDPGDWIADKVPTGCGEYATLKQVCLVCGAESGKTETTKPIAHEYLVKVVDVVPTCVQPEVYHLECRRCGQSEGVSYTGDLDPSNHNYGDWWVDEEATCQAATKVAPQKGHRYKICNDCKNKYEENFWMEHEPSSKPVLVYEPTCTQIGEAVYECKWCPEVMAKEVIPMKPHTWGEWYERNPATEGSLGLWARQCEVCKQTEEKVADHVEHVKEIIPAVPATCTETGLTEGEKCSFCGMILKAQEVVETIPHTEEIIPGTPATCKDTGLTDGVKCSVCDTILKEQEVIETIPHTEEIIPAVPATGKECGWTEGVKCSVCGTILVEPLPTSTKTGLDDVSGEWIYYENGEQAIHVTGIIDFEGGKFFVQNGKLNPINGINQINGTWYFLANGQVQTQHTGFAMYDGEWFIIENGKLDTSASGLMDYNGGRFVIAAGRLVSEKTGLWESKEGWIYVDHGQFRDTVTGLVRYDGEIFYVVNGKLAANFTGTVKDYNGTEFNVVHGWVAE